VYGVVSLISQYFVLPWRQNIIIVSEHLRPAVNKAVCTAVIGQGAEIPEELPPESEDYALFLGRLDFKIKGLDILIKAWASIPSDKRKIPLVIAGGGDDVRVKDYIRQVGAENIVLTGSLNHFEALSYIRKAAFVCVPSRMEGSPLVVYESLALGKPIIGTSIPSIRALLNHNENGLLVSPGDSEALAQAMLVLFDDTKRKTLIKGAKKAGEKFSWKNIAEKQETFYSCVREQSGKC
ncbi:MAG: glycosyltransferase, partial [Deltaproteobacteria bacterium]|nr:glycosyltransferase [Deltaproteobacteria bacterium]